MTYKEARFEVYEFFKMYRSEPLPEYMQMALKAMDDIIKKEEYYKYITEGKNNGFKI